MDTATINLLPKQKKWYNFKLCIFKTGSINLHNFFKKLISLKIYFQRNNVKYVKFKYKMINKC